MGLGASLFLIAVGAIMKYAVNVSAEGFDIGMIGVILMIVGVIGLFTSFAFWNSWGGFNRRDAAVDGGRRGRRTVVDDY